MALAHFYKAIITLRWRPDDRLTEGVLRFRVDVFLPHLVYSSVGQAALFSVDSCRGKLDRVWNGVGVIVRKSSHDHGYTGRMIENKSPRPQRDRLVQYVDTWNV